MSLATDIAPVWDIIQKKALILNCKRQDFLDTKGEVEVETLLPTLNYI